MLTKRVKKFFLTEVVDNISKESCEESFYEQQH